jgi:hypothetical protein
MINLKTIYNNKKDKTMKKVLYLVSFLLFSWCVTGEEISKNKTIRCGSLEVMLNPQGQIKAASFKGMTFINSLGVMGTPAGKGGRLFQGGNPPECVERMIRPAELIKEGQNYIFTKEAILGNRNYPEIIRYKMKMIFSKNEINVSYDIEYLLELKWHLYAGTLIYSMPAKTAAGMGWVSEMQDGTMAKAGHNPKEFNKKNRSQWLHIDNGDRLKLETKVGLIQLVAKKPSYLRGSKNSVNIISIGRDKLVPKGTKQTLKLKILLTLTITNKKRKAQ